MDIKQQVTNDLIGLIENAQLNDEPMWDAAVSFGLPTNFQTQRPYSGINVLILSLAARDRGFTRNEWLTFKQAQAMGAQVRKGAKGVLGVFFKMRDRKDAKPDDVDAKIPMIAPFWVFNVAEIDGLPVEEEIKRPVFDPIEEAERMLVASGARITWAGASAFYRPATDEIYMPDRNRFSSPVNAYAVALHELTHWSGHESRLGRNFSGKKEPYAFEELVAELGAAYLVAHLGLKGAKLENHASYLQHYLRILKDDKSAIFTAARLAGQAFDFILKLTTESANEDEHDTEPEQIAA
jgi:antirestriction protein ArdC